MGVADVVKMWLYTYLLPRHVHVYSDAVNKDIKSYQRL